jgi:hypothetical protein
MGSQRVDVPRAVNDTHDHDRLRLWKVIDGEGTVEGHPKASSKVVARWPGEWKISQRPKGLYDRIDPACRNRLRRFERDRSPDFGEVVFSRVR